MTAQKEKAEHPNPQPPTVTQLTKVVREFLGIDVWMDLDGHSSVVPGFCAIYKVTTVPDGGGPAVVSIDRGDPIFLDNTPPSENLWAIATVFVHAQKVLRKKAVGPRASWAGSRGLNEG